MSRLEGAVVFAGMSAVFLLGFFSVFQVSKVAAVASIVAVLWLWFYLHRIRICSFCDQYCPFRPRKISVACTRKGFSRPEALVFYPVFIFIWLVYLAAIYRFNIYAGMIMTVLMVYIGIIYRVKVCVSCQLPCPINPANRKKTGVGL